MYYWRKISCVDCKISCTIDKAWLDKASWYLQGWKIMKWNFQSYKNLSFKSTSVNVPWNWIAFYQNYFVISPGCYISWLLYHLVVISPGCYISWLDATLEDLQTRPLRQIQLFLRNNSLIVYKLNWSFNTNQ